MLASKSTQSSLKGLPQFTVVMATHSNHFKGANLKRPKIRIVHLFSFFLSFFNQSSTVTSKVLRLKLPPVARESSGVVLLHFVLSITATELKCFFDHGAECTSCWMPSCRCTCTDDASTASAWAAPCNKKEQEQEI